MATAQIKKDQDPALGRLGIFEGKWKTEGEQYATNFGPAAKVNAIENYEWLEGGKFLIHRLNGKLGDNEMACIEMIGHDPGGDRFEIDTFYNNGMKMAWSLRETHPGIWSIIGNWPHKDETFKVRCTIKFADEGNSNTAKWESQDGDAWHTFWDLRSVRLS